MRKTGTLWRARGVRASDFLEQAEDLSLNAKSDILLEIGHSGVAEQG